jgi:hypothetical protein
LRGPRPRAVEQCARFVDPIEAEVQRSDALFEVVDRGWVAGHFALYRGEHRFGLLEALTHGMRAGQGERRLGVGVAPERELGELGAQFGVAGEVRRACRADEQLRRYRRGGVEEEPDHAQCVVGFQRLAALERRRQQQPQLAAAERGQLRAEDVAVERV